MNYATHYWNLVRLDTSGHSKTEAVVSAKALLEQYFVKTTESEIANTTIQQALITLLRDTTTSLDQRSAAELCLRCFISHQIEQACIQLESQFGKYYGFTRTDLFTFVLDDDGKPRSQEQQAGYQPLAIQILQKFDPDRASLTTWTMRLVKQHPELNAFLLERGLCMLSDWAILNEATQKKLRKVLAQFHHLTDSEVEQASILLESYHAIYRRDRILQGQKGQCPPPAEQQLQEIARLVQQKTQQTYSSAGILARLHSLAQRFRQYRISTKGGLPPTQPLDHSETATRLEQLPDHSSEDQEEQRNEFLQFYRQQFLDCLEVALEQVVSDRLQTLKPPKNQAFLMGLQLFHCQGRSMTDIAQSIGLQAQYQVTRLLNLKTFRADVRHWMLTCLRQSVLEQAQRYLTPDHLDRLDCQIEAALSEQVDTLLQADQANAKTPKGYVSGSLFARRLCRYLDQRFADNLPLINP